MAWLGCWAPAAHDNILYILYLISNILVSEIKYPLALKLSWYLEFPPGRVDPTGYPVSTGCWAGWVVENRYPTQHRVGKKFYNPTQPTHLDPTRRWVKIRPYR